MFCTHARTCESFPRVARLKYEGDGLVRAVRAGRYSSRFLEDWLSRLDAHLEGRSVAGWEERHGDDLRFCRRAQAE